MVQERIGVVVVGVDGSEGSRSALRWAADYAAALCVPMVVVMAWHYPVAYGTVVMPGLRNDFEELAAKVASEMAAEAQDAHPGLSVATRVEAGRAAEVLVKQSRTASLLVVGSRGYGSFAGMLAGSVSTHCVHHAHCPVVVVR